MILTQSESDAVLTAVDQTNKYFTMFFLGTGILDVEEGINSLFRDSTHWDDDNDKIDWFDIKTSVESVLPDQKIKDIVISRQT